MKNYNDSEIIPHRSNKNTKDFCKGKKDKAHILVIEPKFSCLSKDKILYYNIRCTNCGKIVKIYLNNKSLKNSIHKDLILEK